MAKFNYTFIFIGYDDVSDVNPDFPISPIVENGGSTDLLFNQVFFLFRHTFMKGIKRTQRVIIIMKIFIKMSYYY